MGQRTAIGWTDHTFNPWWGCSRVSPGCQHCYAETFAKRTGHAVWGNQADRRFFGEKHWREPFEWNDDAAAAGRKALVFCASMADVFEDRDDVAEARARVLRLAGMTPNLVWLFLTKRPENVLGMVPGDWLAGAWPAGAWIGTTVEDGQRAAERVPLLLEIPAPGRFLSCEPLLEPVRLSPGWLCPPAIRCGPPPTSPETTGLVSGVCRAMGEKMGGRFVDWLIVGGESGPGARPMEHEWARQLGEASVLAGVPFFFKQWGGRTPKAGGDEIGMFGRAPAEWKQFPAVFGRG